MLSKPATLAALVAVLLGAGCAARTQGEAGILDALGQPAEGCVAEHLVTSLRGNAFESISLQLTAEGPVIAVYDRDLNGSRTFARAPDMTWPPAESYRSTIVYLAPNESGEHPAVALVRSSSPQTPEPMPAGSLTMPRDSMTVLDVAWGPVGPPVLLGTIEQQVGLVRPGADEQPIPLGAPPLQFARVATDGRRHAALWSHRGEYTLWSDGTTLTWIGAPKSYWSHGVAVSGDRTFAFMADEILGTHALDTIENEQRTRTVVALDELDHDPDTSLGFGPVLGEISGPKPLMVATWLVYEYFEECHSLEDAYMVGEESFEECFQNRRAHGGTLLVMLDGTPRILRGGPYHANERADSSVAAIARDALGRVHVATLETDRNEARLEYSVLDPSRCGAFEPATLEPQ